MKEKIWLSPPHMSGQEIQYVQEAFQLNWIAPVGPHLSRFEQSISERLNGHSVAALASGTAAIHLALMLAGVKDGDEVLCSSFTFSGTCNPIVYLKAKPVFIDSELDTWNMSPSLLEEAIEDRQRKVGKKPAAIIVVHLYGMPAKMDEIMAIAKAHQIPVIEDAAEALGSTLHGKPLGTYGLASILSFNGNKIITTSGGGALVSSDNHLIDKARYLATQAREPALHYEHTEIGYNYRLSNVCAAIGLGQMEVLSDRVAARRKIFESYQLAFQEYPEIVFLQEPLGYFSNRWLTTVTLQPELMLTPAQVVEYLHDQVIEARPLWKPMHQQPVFANYPVYASGVSSKLFNTGICLPSGSNMTAQKVERVVDLLKSLISR